MKVARPLFAVLVVVGVTAALWAYDFLADAGQFKVIEPRFEGSCRPVPGAVGAEDMAADRDTGMLFISSYDRRRAFGGEAVRGAIYGYRLDQESPELVELTADFEGELAPHGISFYRDPAGAALFVVNHPGSRHTVEIFDWDGAELRHRETVAGELLHSPNDVAAVGSRSFYATNDHGNRSALGRTLEDYLRLRRSSVVYYDGERFSVAAEGIAYANGINTSPERDEVYVAATTGLVVLRYARSPADGSLELRETIRVGTGVDNVDVDRHGNLWVAAHPQLLRFVAHAGDAAERSPSQVLWIDPRARRSEQEAPFLETYMGDGTELSGSSVAVAYGARLYIGPVFEEHFLECHRE